MSAFSNYQTCMNDANILVQALKKADNKKAQKHATPQPLYGYQGDRRKQTAEIIISRDQVGGASNDIGFKKNAKGNFEAIISQYDSSHYNAAWLAKIQESYQEIKATSIAEEAGAELEAREKLPNGDVRITFVKAGRS